MQNEIIVYAYVCMYVCMYVSLLILGCYAVFDAFLLCSRHSNVADRSDQ